MSLGRTGILVLLAAVAPVAGVRAEEAVLLRYKPLKGSAQHYRTKMELVQKQTVNGMDIETKMNNEGVSTLTVEEIAADGSVTLKSKNERLKVSMNITQVGGFEFDSTTTERDTSSVFGVSLTPLYERLSGAEYELGLTPLGVVSRVKGYADLLGDLLKDNPIAAQFSGQGSDEAAKSSEQQATFVQLPEKPVKPGDTWEVPYTLELPKLGKGQGKTTFTFEAFDKVGERKTVRLAMTTELSIDLDLDMGDNKVKGNMSISNSTGTVQLDPESGVVVVKKMNVVMGGQLTLNANGMALTIDNQQEQKVTVELID